MLSPGQLVSDPRWFPHNMDLARDVVLMVNRDEPEIRAAGFLDDRSLSPQTPRQVLAWPDLAAAIPGEVRRDVQYIFHIGHVGSTLIARLLGEHPGILSLREPLILRSYFEADRLRGRPEEPWPPQSWGERVDGLTALLSRTFRDGQRSLVKATSFTSEIAHLLVPSRSRALFVYNEAETYVQNILAGEASRQELHQLSGSRLARLAARLSEPPARLWELSEGQRAALGWACEMASLIEAERRLPQGSVMWSEFDEFLRDSAAALSEITQFFGVSGAEDFAQKVSAGPLMTRYSKATEYEYSPRLRREVLAQSGRENREAIRDAMNWLDEAARRFPLIERCLSRRAA